MSADDGTRAPADGGTAGARDKPNNCRMLDAAPATGLPAVGVPLLAKYSVKFVCCPVLEDEPPPSILRVSVHTVNRFIQF